MSSDSPVKWFDNLVGVAYRYYDLRMNVVPLFGDFKGAQEFWRETIKWWNDHSIKIRFVETGDTYWFIMGAETTRVENNRFLFKILPISSHYDRFKKGHEGSAYLRLGVYTKKYSEDVKNDAKCDCGHIKEDHGVDDDDDGGGGDNDDSSCLYEDCKCKKFESFQLNLLKKKKTVTDIEFLTESKVKDDVLAWNCFSVNKYSPKK
ncbi:uncharacterized protein METZ01_LOCUS339494 [marine metagenome]|uniref:Uncharacterized protein n=1 Tax=marine metagenome TaxID=408172 RepID=A0A382QP17_9ZZZZ